MSHKDGDQTTSTTWPWPSKESLGSSTGWPGVEVPILSCKCKSCKNRKKCKIAMVSEFGWPSTKQIDDNHVSWIFFIGFTDRQVPVNKLLLDFLQFIHLREIHFGYFPILSQEVQEIWVLCSKSPFQSIWSASMACKVRWIYLHAYVLENIPKFLYLLYSVSNKG